MLRCSHLVVCSYIPHTVHDCGREPLALASEVQEALAGGDLPPGFGTMQLTGPRVLGPPRDRDAAVALLRTARELGVTVFDSAWYYGPAVTHGLLVEAFGSTLSELLVVTKVGNSRGARGSWVPALDPGSIRGAHAEDLRQLRLQSLALVLLRWQPRPGDEGAFLEALNVLAEAQERGTVKSIGLSNVTLEHVRIAARVLRISAVSNAYSVLSRRGEDVLHWCTAHRVPFLAYYPLLGGEVVQRAAVQQAARTLGVTPAQVAIAWLRAISPSILPIPGTSNERHLRDNIDAHHLELPSHVVQELSQVPASGT